MNANYFDLSYKRSFRIRWITKFLKYSGFIELGELQALINEKIARIEKRRGELTEETVSRIIENLLMAKIAKRYLDRRIRLFKPKVRKDSPTPAFRRNGFHDLPYDFESSCGSIFKEQHYRLRKNPSILMPGFLPDGNEAFYRLRRCFLKFGSVYCVNYPTRNFHKETIFHQLYDTIREINNPKLKNAGQGSEPFLVGTSFGCHMIMSFMGWLRRNGLDDKVRIRGVVLISPVLSLEDLVDPALERQRTLVGRAVSHMVSADSNDAEGIRKAMQKAKSIMVKMFTSGRDLMNFESKDLIPVFAIEDEVLSVFRQTADVDDGYFNRFLEMKLENPLPTTYFSSLPTLVLFAEGEGDVMAPHSPTFTCFSDINQLQRIFPNGSVEFVYSKSKTRKVTHSDLIFQADRFTEHLEPWLNRIVS